MSVATQFRRRPTDAIAEDKTDMAKWVLPVVGHNVVKAAGVTINAPRATDLMAQQTPTSTELPSAPKQLPPNPAL